MDEQDAVDGGEGGGGCFAGAVGWAWPGGPTTCTLTCAADASSSSAGFLGALYLSGAFIFFHTAAATTSTAAPTPMSAEIATSPSMACVTAPMIKSTAKKTAPKTTDIGPMGSRQWARPNGFAPRPRRNPTMAPACIVRWRAIKRFLGEQANAVLAATPKPHKAKYVGLSSELNQCRATLRGTIVIAARDRMGAWPPSLWHHLRRWYPSGSKCQKYVQAYVINSPLFCHLLHLLGARVRVSA